MNELRLARTATGLDLGARHRHDGGADDEQFEHFAGSQSGIAGVEIAPHPGVRMLGDGDVDDAGRPQRFRFPLEPLDRELTCVVEGVRVGRELAAHHIRRLQEPGRNVINAIAHHEADGAISGFDEHPEFLARKRGLEGLALLVFEALPAAMLDRRADGHELDDVLAERVGGGLLRQ
jgi:hypothetical protein